MSDLDDKSESLFFIYKRKFELIKKNKKIEEIK